MSCRTDTAVTFDAFSPTEFTFGHPLSAVNMLFIV